MVTKKYTYHKTADFPDDLEDGIIYISEMWKVLQFKCPCGCGETIELNTLLGAKPHWKYNIASVISISPSVNRIVGCKSHFTITNGEVKFHKY